jgi:hypothetical protein
MTGPGFIGPGGGHGTDDGKQSGGMSGPGGGMTGPGGGNGPGNGKPNGGGMTGPNGGNMSGPGEASPSGDKPRHKKPKSDDQPGGN